MTVFFLCITVLSAIVSLGGANLHVNVSVEIIGETFRSDFLDKGSEIFLNKTSWLETQVSNVLL